MEDGKLMSVWMFPFVYVFMDTDNEMEDSFRCHQIQDFCIWFSFQLYNERKYDLWKIEIKFKIVEDFLNRYLRNKKHCRKKLYSCY